MKFIVDVCLSLTVVQELRLRGIDVEHWSSNGPANAKDITILSWSADHEHVLITADTDFAHLLATFKNTTPSVVILRTASHSPKVVVPLIFSVIEQWSDELERGCLVSVDETKARLRVLPIGGPAAIE
jgi:predicted nuclease of predicted toxin-antitoxin system